jgi:hypothetical protein
MHFSTTSAILTACLPLAFGTPVPRATSGRNVVARQNDAITPAAPKPDVTQPTGVPELPPHSCVVSFYHYRSGSSPATQWARQVLAWDPSQKMISTDVYLSDGQTLSDEGLVGDRDHSIRVKAPALANEIWIWAMDGHDNELTVGYGDARVSTDSTSASTPPSNQVQLSAPWKQIGGSDPNQPVEQRTLTIAFPCEL